MWPRTDLTDLLEVDHPILQAPMGGESTAQMVSAVSNAGGLGGLGCSYMSAEEIRQNVDEIRSSTNRSFNLNFFSHPEPNDDPKINEQTRALIAPFYEELGIENIPTQVEPPCDTFNESKLALLLDIRPKVVSFHFGLPPARMVRALQDVGSVVLCSATSWYPESAPTG